jgi:hypothetical protein
VRLGDRIDRKVGRQRLARALKHASVQAGQDRGRKAGGRHCEHQKIEAVMDGLRDPVESGWPVAASAGRAVDSRTMKRTAREILSIAV